MSPARPRGCRPRRWNAISERVLARGTPIEASAAQIDAFDAIFDNNYRPTQPLDGRTIG